MTQFHGTILFPAYKRRLQLYREHTLPLLKELDDGKRLRIVRKTHFCSIIDCIFRKLLFFLKVDGDASEDRVVLELQRCLSREIEAMRRTGGAPEQDTMTSTTEEAVNESENSFFLTIRHNCTPLLNFSFFFVFVYLKV